MEEQVLRSIAFAATREALSLVHKQLLEQIPQGRYIVQMQSIFWECDHRCVICHRQIYFQSDTDPSWRYMQNHGHTKICKQCDKEMGRE
jgi:predicted lipase